MMKKTLFSLGILGVLSSCATQDLTYIAKQQKTVPSDMPQMFVTTSAHADHLADNQSLKLVEKEEGGYGFVTLKFKDANAAKNDPVDYISVVRTYEAAAHKKEGSQRKLSHWKGLCPNIQPVSCSTGERVIF